MRLLSKKRKILKLETIRWPYSIPVMLILIGIISYLVGAFCVPRFSLGQSLLYQLGGVLVVGGLISVALVLSEYVAYIEKRLANIFLGDSFLQYLGPEKLEDIRSIITKKLCIVPWDEEGQSLYNLIIKKIFPFLSKPYRKNYRDFYDLRRLANRKDVILHKTVTDYDLVSLRESEIVFPLGWELTLKKIPNFSEKLLKTVELYVDDKSVSLTLPVPSKKGDEFAYEFQHNLSLTGKKHIKLVLEYYTPLRDELVLTMGHLTKGLILNLTFEENFAYEARVFGLLPNYTINPSSRGITVEYPEWMLPQHGIVILWRKKGSQI